MIRRLLMALALVASTLTMTGDPASAITIRTVTNPDPTATGAGSFNAAVAASSPGDRIQIKVDMICPASFNSCLNVGDSAPDNITLYSAIEFDLFPLDTLCTTPNTSVCRPAVIKGTGDMAAGDACLDLLDADGWIIEDLWFKDCTNGIRAQGVAGLTIDNVRVYGAHVLGILIAAPYGTNNSNPSTNVVIQDSLIEGSISEGIYLGNGETAWTDRSSGITVRRNRVRNTGAEAVDVKPGVANVTVQNNDFSGNSLTSNVPTISVWITTINSPGSVPGGTINIVDNDIWQDGGINQVGIEAHGTDTGTTNIMGNRCWAPVTWAGSRCIWLRGTRSADNPNRVVVVKWNNARTEDTIGVDDPNGGLAETVTENMTYGAVPAQFQPPGVFAMRGDGWASFPGPVTGQAGDPPGAGFDYAPAAATPASCPVTPTWLCAGPAGSTGSFGLTQTVGYSFSG